MMRGWFDGESSWKRRREEKIRKREKKRVFFSGQSLSYHPIRRGMEYTHKMRYTITVQEMNNEYQAQFCFPFPFFFLQTFQPSGS